MQSKEGLVTSLSSQIEEKNNEIEELKSLLDEALQGIQELPEPSIYPYDEL